MMKTGIDARLAKLEARQPRKGQMYRIVVKAEYDPDEELRKRGIVLGPDDDVIWRELVPAHPRRTAGPGTSPALSRNGATDENGH